MRSSLKNRGERLKKRNDGPIDSILGGWLAQFLVDQEEVWRRLRTVRTQVLANPSRRRERSSHKSQRRSQCMMTYWEDITEKVLRWPSGLNVGFLQNPRQEKANQAEWQIRKVSLVMLKQAALKHPNLKMLKAPS